MVRSSAGSTGFSNGISSSSKTTQNRAEVSSVHRQRYLLILPPGACLLEICSRPRWRVTRDEIYSLIATGDISSISSRHCSRTGEGDGLAGEAVAASSINARLPRSPKPVLRRRRTGLGRQAWAVLNAGLNAITLLAEDRSIAEIPSDKFDESFETRASDVERLGKGRRSATYLSAAAARERNGPGGCHPPLSDSFTALRGEPHDDTPPRTLRRWVAAYRTAQHKDGSGYLGLVPRPNPATLRINSLTRQRP